MLYNPQGTHVTPEMDEQQAARARRWEKPAVIAALLVVPYLLLNHYADDARWEHVGDGLYVLLWGFFVVEVLAMLRISPDKSRWVAHNVLDVTVLVLTAPAPFIADEFEALQALWVLRILDLLPYVHRHVIPITVLRFAALLWTLAIFAGGMMYATLEADHPEGPENLFDAFYFASTVISTVGFGDILPHKWETKLLCMALQLTGPVLAAIIVAGLLPKFDQEFARGFAATVQETVDRIAGEVQGVERHQELIAKDIAEMEQGERAQDRVLAEILLTQRRLLERTAADPPAEPPR